MLAGFPFCVGAAVRGVVPADAALALPRAVRWRVTMLPPLACPPVVGPAAPVSAAGSAVSSLEFSVTGGVPSGVVSCVSPDAATSPDCCTPLVPFGSAA